MNKCTVFDVIKRQQEPLRQILILRLLSFNPGTIRWSTGIKLAYVKLILGI